MTACASGVGLMIRVTKLRLPDAAVSK
jgi:hypothetical protein